MKQWILIGLTSLSCGAAAADTGFYAGGGWSSVDAAYAPSRVSVAFPAGAGIPEGSISTAALEPLGSQAWRLIAGYRALDWLAVEADFGKFGGNSRNTGRICVRSPCPARESGAADLASLTALAIYPSGSIDWFVKAGVARWRADLTTYNPDGSRLEAIRDDGTEFTYGGGVQAHLSRVVTRLELQHVKLGEDSANLLTFGLAYMF